MDNVIFRAVTRSSDETEAVGQSLAEIIASSPEYESDWIFVALYGGLGAGKTAFVRGLASVIAPGTSVTSPTYAIVNEYGGPKVTLVHFDFYRIESEDDLYSCGYDDYFRPGIVIAAEWCERIPYALPSRRFEVKITGMGDSQREIIVTAPAARRPS
ncbi:MAG: tRNA (adenosine(37)-N6)-threonylcarbamoyltransferase complex ATPase subunit type 1 TsaE [Eubacteriales bacterium]|jgi:tRNA threonylcarbamoyladenosine biosynthesis protein TsaE|nr:tRNA (adenosine(37)-N6)-threonylcarbamoyltransferase complex ATPase subunit type 1 TsaE [Clostridiales bacterium]